MNIILLAILNRLFLHTQIATVSKFLDAINDVITGQNVKVENDGNSYIAKYNNDVNIRFNYNDRYIITNIAVD